MRIEEKQLINELRKLRKIEPKQEWREALKFQILQEKREIGWIEAVKEILAPRRGFVYSFAYFVVLVAIVAVGLLGFVEETVPGDLLFPIKKVVENSEIFLKNENDLVKSFNNRVNELQRVVNEGKKMNLPPAIGEVKNQALELTKGLRDNKVKDSQTIQEIASSLQSLAYIPGADLTNLPEIQALYQTIVETQIADLEKRSLTSEQKQKLEEVKELYREGKYVQALESILWMTKEN